MAYMKQGTPWRGYKLSRSYGYSRRRALGSSISAWGRRAKYNTGQVWAKRAAIKRAMAKKSTKGVMVALVLGAVAFFGYRWYKNRQNGD